MEIERKFRVTRIPDGLEQYECRAIEQGYLCTSPVVRIRKSNEEYYLTYKSKRGDGKTSCAIESEEVEVPLTREAYLHLRDKIDNRPITKKRYVIPLDNGLKVELDLFEGALKGLYFAEVEFPDRESAEAFRKPDWFGDDISFDERFRNSYLSTVENLSELEK